MAERATIAQGCQIGPEVTPGTAVAAGKRLGSLGFTLSPHIETNAQRPMGQKYANAHILGKEWTAISYEGAPCYTELPYLLSSLVNTATVTEYMDGATHTGAFKWVFTSNPNSDDTPKTFTIEQGSTARAGKAAGCLLTGAEFEISRDEITVTGDGIGGLFQDGVALTATPTRLPQVLVRPTEMSFYKDATWAALGTTKLTRAISGGFSLTDRFAPLWVVDAAKASYAATVESEPTLEASLLQVMDEEGMDPLVNARAGDTVYLRMEAVGPRIYDGTTTDYYHKLTIDLACQVADADDPSDEDGVYAMAWTLGGVVDPVTGNAFRIEVTTTTATL
jgi:hypothetical protein